LAQLFKEDEDGKKFYEAHKNDSAPLSVKDKRLLASIIAAHFIDDNKSLSKRDVEQLAKSIVEIFPHETATAYICDNSGILYSKLKNLSVKYRKILHGESSNSSSAKRIKLTAPPSEETENLCTTQDKIDADNFVRTHPNEALNQINDHWVASLSLRHKFIRDLQETAGIEEIISHYKSYGRNDGYFFVSIKNVFKIR
jgi:hypothetical protein